MEIQALEQLIKGRRSIRKWSKKTVPDDLVWKALELATWAPNGGNYQGWYFVVVKRQKTIENIADAVQSVSDQIASWPEAATWQDEVERYRQNVSFFRNAPVCIGVLASHYQSVTDKVLTAREPLDPDAQRIQSYRRFAPTAIQSAAAAVTTMLLAFHQMGLGAIWLAAPLMAKKDIETILGTPSNLQLICLVAAGYPDESPKKDRKPVKEVVRFIH